MAKLLQRDVVAEARKICAERGIDPDKTMMQLSFEAFKAGKPRKLPAYDPSKSLGDEMRRNQPDNPAFWGFMDEAAGRLRAAQDLVKTTKKVRVK